MAEKLENVHCINPLKLQSNDTLSGKYTKQSLSFFFFFFFFFFFCGGGGGGWEWGSEGGGGAEKGFFTLSFCYVHFRLK